MSNVLFTRDFNSDTLGTTPADLTLKAATPDVVPWQVTESGPNSIYPNALQVLDYSGDLCVALFPAVDPTSIYDSESLVLFRTAAYLAFSGLQCNPAGNFWTAAMIQDNYKSIAEWEYDFEVVLETDDFVLNTSFWYVLRFRAYTGVGTKLKIWKYGDAEPESWQLTSTQYDGASQPGVHFGLKGGQIDFAYFSVGYGVGNAPTMPEAPPPEPFNRTCSSALAFSSSGLGEVPPVELQKTMHDAISFRASTRIWNAYSLAHLSFNALPRMFNFNATEKRFVYTAKPGREE